ncbi:MAG TPA: ATP-binding protein [Bryobacteraceae bacterium]|jgi:two-component system NarL family sensor kinase|nr:ATP-binding protein [Bryobacteraceae bacterium]
MPETGCLPEILLQQSPACVWLVREDLVFERVYGSSQKLLGRPPEELTGKKAQEALGAEGAAWCGRFTRALAGEDLRLRQRLPDGTWYVSIFPVQGKDGARYAGGMAREITPWNTAEHELRNTVLGALKAQEFERNTLSKFLHDVVGQNLTALGLQLDLARMDVESISPETCLRITEIQKVLETIMEQVREYSYHLNPSAVERAGLRSALDRMVVHVRGRFPGGLRVNVDPSLKIDPKIASAFYHIAQEAVENAVQHSSCSSIEVAVKSTRTGAQMEVRDNGKGFDPADILGGSRGLGLLSMEHYAAQAGLDLSIVSDRKTGTTVRAAVAEAA